MYQWFDSLELLPTGTRIRTTNENSLVKPPLVLQRHGANNRLNYNSSESVVKSVLENTGAELSAKQTFQHIRK